MSKLAPTHPFQQFCKFPQNNSSTTQALELPLPSIDLDLHPFTTMLLHCVSLWQRSVHSSSSWLPIISFSLLCYLLRLLELASCQLRWWWFWWFWRGRVRAAACCFCNAACLTATAALCHPPSNQRQIRAIRAFLVGVSVHSATLL